MSESRGVDVHAYILGVNPGWIIRRPLQGSVDDNNALASWMSSSKTGGWSLGSYTRQLPLSTAGSTVYMVIWYSANDALTATRHLRSTTTVLGTFESRNETRTFHCILG
ncbi:hypothetical protein PISMIDRAFT_618470 [Pisolithus microcarpus 441]|uniref:Uncharacterized protein n=1 Tax=Pisolithus microcarpus 441 TaxID=765257 RepID=A0A0C9Z0C4_9AGAM|nr:hypothetical protein BKA83DRAFT_618470 [Pisolithus microcarpus]KIK19749.1 hypothetical protein PISMIDRAFT_618470 [Pisolithus microcarpus 441]